MLRGTRSKRRFALAIIDSVIFSISLYLAISVRFDSFLPLSFVADKKWQIVSFIILQLIAFRVIGIYRPILRYSSLTLIRDSARAVLLSATLLITLTYFLGDWALARSIIIINTLLVLILVVSIRLALRKIVRWSISSRKLAAIPEKNPERLLVYGAGAAGAELFHSLSYSPRYKIVGFVDDHPDLHGKSSLEGLAVYSPVQLPDLWSKNKFDSVVMAMPSVARSVRRQIFETLKQQSIPVKTVPSLASIISGQVTIQELRNVDISDLLGREEVSPNVKLLQQQTKHKAVLVTGAGGSIGSELCRQITQQVPSCLVLFERNEFALYKIHQELTESYPSIQCVPCLGSVIDSPYLRFVLKKYRIETVYHAAAYKHVPLLEMNIAKGIENNVVGTLTAAQSAIDCKVKQFVMISTDKAVRPTNVMGTTKRVAELSIQALSAQENIVTRFSIVRFGNVLGSSGSVVPRFRKQIAQGGPITLTHPEITRFFMSIPEAARLVIQAGALSKGGEVFLLDMGEPVKIYDLAVQMIKLSGMVPEDDIPIKITGLRPGEKLYEELLISSDSACSTIHPKIYYSQENFIPWEDLEPKLNLLVEKARSNNAGIVKGLLRLLVPEYKPQNIEQAPDKPVSPLLPAVSGLENRAHRSNRESVSRNSSSLRNIA